jgi:ATP-dependent DNA helicase RecQ
MKNGRTILLRKDPLPRRERRSRTEKAKALSTTLSRPGDEALWEALRTLRMSIAREAGVPPYVIFHDTTLQQIVQLRPQTPHEFGEITGVGERKLARYGEAFLEVIKSHTEG